MRIINDDVVLDFLDTENGGAVNHEVQQNQIHLNYGCTCKITQDNKGFSLTPCRKHTQWAQDNRNGLILHKHIH